MEQDQIQPKRCKCGSIVHLVDSLCEPKHTNEKNPQDRVLYSFCHRLEIICFGCHKRFGDWHYGTMFEDSADYFKLDAEIKLTREWNQYVDTDSTLAAHS